ncbi:MAG: PASTA domain-containing protein [Actinomycetota bacterium]|nr:MAG: PASTA domain-containing protein [Actinomycetota bacterium]
MYTARLQENIGKILHGRYTLVAAIGQGASGDVYLAQDLSLGRKVAIKLLHSSLAGDTFFLKRFQSEAKSAASLNHPNIMRVFDWGESGSTPYLVLEYLAGGSLREYLNTGELLTESQAASLMLQVAQGLSYAHGRGYVHRDIKPANLLFDDEARIRIADFGLARALSEAAWTEPIGTLMGTARYASPEQALAKESDRSSDVYSLGLVMHEALLGYLPFTGDTTVSLLMARIHGDVSVPAETGALQPILESCLKLSSTDRITSMDLVSQLEKLVRFLDPPTPLKVTGPSPMITDENGDLTEVGEIPMVSSGAALDGAAASKDNPVPENAASTPELAVVPDLLAPRPAPKTHEMVPGPKTTRVHGTSSKPPGSRRPFWFALTALILLVLIAAVSLAGIPSKVYSSVFTTKVPLVVGDTLAVAEGSITSSHLKVGTISAAFSSAVKKGEVSSETPKYGTSLPRGKLVNLVVSKGPAPVEVPALVGLPVTDAENKLKSIGLVPVIQKSYSETAPLNQVMSASPSSGLQDVGTKITLTISQGPAPRQVPNLVGESEQTALAQLKALELVSSESKAYSTTVPAGTVISQTQTAGSMVQRGSTVAFVVSKGPQMVTVPNVVGDTLQQAEATLNQAGLTVGSVYTYFGSNTVVATSPRSGTSVQIGSPVAIVTG